MIQIKTQNKVSQCWFQSESPEKNRVPKAKFAVCPSAAWNQKMTYKNLNRNKRCLWNWLKKGLFGKQVLVTKTPFTYQSNTAFHMTIFKNDSEILASLCVKNWDRTSIYEIKKNNYK